MHFKFHMFKSKENTQLCVPNFKKQSSVGKVSIPCTQKAVFTTNSNQHWICTVLLSLESSLLLSGGLQKHTPGWNSNNGAEAERENSTQV